MSYSIEEAKNELDRVIEEATRYGDVDTLRKIASRVKGLGEDEMAEDLLKVAVRFENYDQEEREQEQDEQDTCDAEAHYSPSEGFDN